MDTSGDEHANSRIAHYTSTDTFMVCVSTSSRTSLENVDRWIAEIRMHNITATVVLVLTKNDLSEQENAQVRYDDLVAKR